MSKSRSLAQSRYANEVKRAKHEGRDPEKSAEVLLARRELAAAKLQDYIAAVLTQAPELSEAQKSRLAALFHGGAR